MNQYVYLAHLSDVLMCYSSIVYQLHILLHQPSYWTRSKLQLKAMLRIIRPDVSAWCSQTALSLPACVVSACVSTDVENYSETEKAWTWKESCLINSTQMPVLTFTNFTFVATYSLLLSTTEVAKCRTVSREVFPRPNSCLCVIMSVSGFWLNQLPVRLQLRTNPSNELEWKAHSFNKARHTNISLQGLNLVQWSDNFPVDFHLILNLFSCGVLFFKFNGATGSSRTF